MTNCWTQLTHSVGEALRGGPRLQARRGRQRKGGSAGGSHCRRISVCGDRPNYAPPGKTAGLWFGLARACCPSQHRRFRRLSPQTHSRGQTSTGGLKNPRRMGFQESKSWRPSMKRGTSCLWRSGRTFRNATNVDNRLKEFHKPACRYANAIRRTLQHGACFWSYRRRAATRQQFHANENLVSSSIIVGDDRQTASPKTSEKNLAFYLFPLYTHPRMETFVLPCSECSGCLKRFDGKRNWQMNSGSLLFRVKEEWRPS